MKIEIDNEAMERFKKAHLFGGGHSAGSAELCAMEWARILAKEGHGDQPDCVDPLIAGFMRSANDNWPDAERDRLKPYVVRSLGTRADSATERRRAIACLDWIMRVQRPLWIEAAGMSELAAEMRALPEIVDEKSFRAAEAVQTRSIAYARDARAAWAAWDAWAARAAWAAWDARDAWAAWDARAAWAARAAWDAWDAWAAWDARAAWAARDAWAAWAAIGGLIAARGIASLAARSTDDQKLQAGVDALDGVARRVRDAELALLDRLISIDGGAA